MSTRLIVVLILLALLVATCGGDGRATETSAAVVIETTAATVETTTTMPTTATVTTMPTTTMLVTTTEAGRREAPSDLDLDLVLRDDSLKERRQRLDDDLSGFGAAMRWMANHPMADEDFELLNDLTQSVADDLGVNVDLGGERNVLAVLASFGPPSTCQWTAEGIPPDDIKDILTEAAEPHTSDPDTASSFASLVISAARNAVCPEFDSVWALTSASGSDVLIVADAFDHSGSGWPTGTLSGGYVLYEGGFYRIVPEFGWLLPSVWPDAHPNVVVTASMRPLGANELDTGFGVLCRTDVDGALLVRGYLFALFANGSYQILLYEGGNEPRKMLEGTSPAIHTGDAWNTVTAVCDGSRLALIVNGMFVDQVEDATLTDGLFGLAGWTSVDDSAEVVVNRILVTEPAPELGGLLDTAGGQPSATTPTQPLTSAAEPQDDLPTYSDVVAAYPAGLEPCISEGEIWGGEGGNYTIGGGAILDPDGGLFCIGSRYTTAGPTVLPDGTPLSEGSFVTIDGQGNMIQVSSFD